MQLTPNPKNKKKDGIQMFNEINFSVQIYYNVVFYTTLANKYIEIKLIY